MAFLIGKNVQHRRKNQAWLGLDRLSKISDRVSKRFWNASVQDEKWGKVFIEVYIDNRSIFIIIYYIKERLAIQNKRSFIIEEFFVTH
jgi:hypothetical protein